MAIYQINAKPERVFEVQTEEQRKRNEDITETQLNRRHLSGQTEPTTYQKPNTSSTQSGWSARSGELPDAMRN